MQAPIWRAALDIILCHYMVRTVTEFFQGCVKGTPLPRAEFGETNIHDI